MCSKAVSKSLASDFLKLSEVFPGPTSGARVRELKAWLVAKGVRDFEAVPLNCDKVGKVGFDEYASFQFRAF
jgi:hypothetical protein